MASQEFCELVPTAEECQQVQPQPGAGGDGEMRPRPEGDDMRKMDDKHDIEGQIAQIDFFFVALANLANLYFT